MTTTHLFIIRHGLTEWNIKRKIQGVSDIPLNDKGREQAEKLASYLLTKDIKHVYSSDLLRAKETAEIICNKKKIPLHLSPNLRERNVGDWEGLTMFELKKKYKDYERIRVTGGKYGVESTRYLAKRIFQEINKCLKKHAGEKIVLISHGMIINVFLRKISPVKISKRIQLDNTGISIVSHNKEDGWQIHDVNLTPHLN